jgi:hypothetical protein
MDDDRTRSTSFKAMLVTLVILSLIVVVAYFARQKITSWIQYVAIDPGPASNMIGAG